MRPILPIALVAVLTLSACATLRPQLPESTADIADAWPTLPEEGAAPEVAPVVDGAAISELEWRELFTEPRLHVLIEQALEYNRDLRMALLNVERARAQHRIQRADRLPSIDASGSLTRVGGAAPLTDEYVVQLGVSSFELDLFGRVRNLSDAALQQYLASEEAQRSAQLSLVSEVARLWLTLAADLELKRVAEATLVSHETGFQLTQQRYRLGAVSALDVAQARTIVETVRADTARFAGLVAQDINALRLLIGGAIDPALLPDEFNPQISGLHALPAGVPSEVLLRRPDVLAAEHRLLAANANIGAARAAFFPSIRLTAGIGTISPEFSDLFDSGTDFWNFIPAIHLPIFQGGRLRAAAEVAEVDQAIALADYEKALQTGFREVADALALTATLAEQARAQVALVEAAQEAHDLSEVRYRAGGDSYLNLLDSQRTLYAARQSWVTIQLAEQNNRVLLYKALGGGWQRGDEGR